MTPQTLPLLDRQKVILRDNRRRRLNLRMLFLIVSLVAYAMMLIPGIDLPCRPLLLFAPMIFLLEPLLSGKSFRCPICQTPFTLQAAAIAIATGKCSCCGNQALELPPPEPPLWDNREWRDAPTDPSDRRRNHLIIGGLVALTAFLIANEIWMPHVCQQDWIKSYCRFFACFTAYSYLLLNSCLFLLAYLVMRYPGRDTDPRMHCPHCGEALQSLAPVVIASGRCGHCGNTVLRDHPTLPPGLIYRLDLENPWIAEFLWFLQICTASAMIIAAMIQSWKVLGGLAAIEIIIGVFWLIRRWQAEVCDHRRPSRIVKCTGRCGICGEDLTADPALFYRTQPGDEIIAVKAPGICRSGLIIFYLAPVAAVEIQAIHNILTMPDPSRRIGMIVCALLLLLMAAGALALLLRQKILTGIVLAADTLTLVGAADKVIRHSEIADVTEKEGRLRGKQYLYWQIRTKNGKKHKLNSESWADQNDADKMRKFLNLPVPDEVKSSYLR